MTDQQTYTAESGGQLYIQRCTRPPDALFIACTAPLGAIVPTARLLAMIDAADPDAMRAYLRETAPDFVADTLRPAAGPAADHFDYLDTVPEGMQR